MTQDLATTAPQAAGAGDPPGEGSALAHGPLLDKGGVTFRLWAPGAERVLVRVETPGAGGDPAITPQRPVQCALTPGAEGWFSAHLPGIGPGARYRFCRDDGPFLADPAACFLPEGVEGPAEVVDLAALARRARHSGWRGRPWDETVLYELHVGAFSPSGSFTGVRGQLDTLADLGVTALELMPLATCAGRRNWGYDGVFPYAPTAAYGRPEDLADLVAAAHARGLMVFVDVVYNHLGPEGNALADLAPAALRHDRLTPWGASLDFRLPALRRFMIDNALYWLTVFEIDGLRLDAVHCLGDEDADDVLDDLAERVGATLPPGRRVHLVLENDANEARRLTGRAVEGGAQGGATGNDAAQGARGRALYTAQWNDDIHHAAHVLATGETDGYYRDVAISQPGVPPATLDPAGAHSVEPLGADPEVCEPLGDPPAGGAGVESLHPARVRGAALVCLARSLAEGFCWQGAPSAFRQGRARGEPSGHLPPSAFVAYLQNHDQVGNRAFGERLSRLTPDPVRRALSAIVLLSPQIPLLFMGEEWGSLRPFLFFCDFKPALAKAVRTGRLREFAAFARFRAPASRRFIPDPNDPQTFAKSSLDWTEAQDPPRAACRAWHRRLLTIRRERMLPLHRRLVAGGGRVVQPERLDQAITRGVLEVTWDLAPEPGAEPGAGEGGSSARSGSVGRLVLLAALTDHPPPALGPPAGASVLFRSDDPESDAPDAAPPLGPWTVLWALMPPADGVS